MVFKKEIVLKASVSRTSHKAVLTFTHYEADGNQVHTEEFIR